MMKAVALTAAVAVVAVGLTRVAAADDDVAGVAVKYGSCGTERYKCGTDYSRCSTKYGVCLRYGCKRDLTYACEKTESYDCDKTVYESYTKSVRKTRGCDKKVDEECTKYRKVSYTCSKQREETCTRRKHKTCYKSWRTESYTCTKTEQKEVSCSNGRTYGYDGKKCYKSHSYEGTCSKQVGVGGYDCGVEERYTCTKSYDATCHKDEAYTATCTVRRGQTPTRHRRCRTVPPSGVGAERGVRGGTECVGVRARVYLRVGGWDARLGTDPGVRETAVVVSNLFYVCRQPHRQQPNLTTAPHQRALHTRLPPENVPAHLSRQRSRAVVYDATPARACG